MDETAGFILVKGDQGLGNRILSLLSASLLARITGRRLVVDWRDPFYSADGSDAFRQLLYSDLALPLEALPDTDSVLPAVWRGHLHDSAPLRRRQLLGKSFAHPRAWEALCVPLDRVDRRERVLVFTTYFEQIDALRSYLTGELGALRSRSTSEILHRLWSEHLALTPPLRERVDAFRRASFDRATLGVHVRASDRRTRVAAIENIAARLVAREPDLRLFLATDNAEVLHRYRMRFADVVAIEKWFPPPGEPLHAHPGRPDAIADAADALVDLHLLSACDRLIIDSRSSFGRLAALRSRASAEHVVDVHPGRFLPGIVRWPLLRLRDTVVGWWRSRGR